ncbi:hypothetical protein GALL_373830 [mine drainage metagenome]|uniref:Uncharacterized protein n=1 Tax=mine drainage metagenome TaxID=410659 RepID=A0A1J5QLL6_9ZZZZ
MEVVRDGVLVDLRDRPFLGAYGTGEVPEVVDRERDVGADRLADRLAVVPGLGDREHLEVLLHAVGDLVEDHGALGGGGLPPGAGRAVSRVEGPLDVGRVSSGDLGERPAGHRGRVLEVPS